jgi:membrane protein implicated in regulation of membrane protease activity
MILLLKALGPIDWVMVVAWAIIFLVTLFIELETMDLVTIWFCLSSLVSLILGVLFLKPIWQIILFLVLSIGLILLTKPLAKKKMKTGIIRTNTDRFIGEIGIITQKILPNEIGEVKIENQLWRAINHEGLVFEPGEAVIIDAISGIKLVVSKINGSGTVDLIKK